MTSIPTCPCVLAARRISILPIPDRHVSEGEATSNSSCGPALGYLIVRCGYCGTTLKVEEGFRIL